MSKYGHANKAVAQAIESATADGWDSEEIILALVVASIAKYRSLAGRDATREALNYELNELGGGVDTQFIRAR